MPPFPKQLNQKPRRVKTVKPPTHEMLLRSALVGVLRRLGKVSHVIPTDLALIALAKNFSEGEGGLADDKGGLVDVRPFDLKAWQATLPISGTDENIPF